MIVYSTVGLRAAIMRRLAAVPAQVAVGARQWLVEEAPTIVTLVQTHVPHPSADHPYAKGALSRSVTINVAADRPAADVTMGVAHASYADRGYTRRGEATARSYDMRGIEAHREGSYVRTGVEDALSERAAETLGQAVRRALDG